MPQNTEFQRSYDKSSDSRIHYRDLVINRRSEWTVPREVLVDNKRDEVNLNKLSLHAKTRGTFCIFFTINLMGTLEKSLE